MKLIESVEFVPSVVPVRSDSGRKWVKVSLGAHVYYLSPVEAFGLADELVDVAEEVAE